MQEKYQFFLTIIYLSIWTLKISQVLAKTMLISVKTTFIATGH
jgi:hypothetical protein